MEADSLGPDVATGIKDVKEGLSWSSATVIRNEAANLNANHRLIHLSVSDHVDMLYGRKVQGVPDSPRWMESYTLPGQFVALRLAEADNAAGAARPPQMLYGIACSPYQSRRDSAYIDASIIEVAVDRDSGGLDAQLAGLAPGAVIEVSQVVGRGFASLFNSYVGLPSALEEQRAILAIAVGLRGMAPMRAMLNWTPVQAHATAHNVTCYYVESSPSAAAFVTEWDQWRDAGVRFAPLYTDQAVAGDGPGSPAAAASDGAAVGGDPPDDGDATLGLLEQALFLRPGGLEGALGARASEVTVVLAGVSGTLASQLANELSFKGVARERILFCDFF